MTKLEIQHLIDCVSAIVDLVPKGKKMEALGAANEVFLYLEKQKRDAEE